MHTAHEPSGRVRWLRVGTAAIATAALVSLVTWQHAPASLAAEPPASLAAESPARPAPSVPMVAPGSYADTVERVAPAVVAIHSTRSTVRQTSQLPPGFDSPFFERFFGGRSGETPRAPRYFRQEGLGSGVIASSDGYILTNHHVVDGADEISVELSDHRTFEASLVGSDPASDLAVLKVEATGLTPLPIGDSDAVRVGDVALAFGNPLGVGQTVTMGIISAKSRATGVGDGSFEDFLQTDAPINRGNSGGALVNATGELIGINSQIMSPTGGNIGIGFAVPSNMARHVMDQLVADGQVHRGRLGVTVQTLTSDLARSLGLARVSGAIVSSVEDGGPAQAAGVQRGDVVTSFDGTSVENANALRNRVAETLPGTYVALGILRDGTPRTVDVKLGELSASVARADDRSDAPDDTGLGMTVSPVTPQLAQRFELDRDARGLVVTDLDPAGAAVAKGLRPGDLIEEVNGATPERASDLRAALQDAERPALLLVARGGDHLYLALSRADG